MCAEVSSFRKIKRYTARLPDPRGWCSGRAGPGPATRAPASPGPALGLRRSHAASLLPPLPVWPQAAHLPDALAPDGVPGRLQGTQCPPGAAWKAPPWTRLSGHERPLLAFVWRGSVPVTRTPMYEEWVNYFEWRIYLIFVIFTS